MFSILISFYVESHIPNVNHIHDKNGMDACHLKARDTEGIFKSHTYENKMLN